jgi:pimeloyl-ACP methyl ester carboxylesterase
LDTLPPLQAPTTLLWSTVASELEGQEFRHALGELRKDWASLTHARSIINVAGSGHYVQRDAPQTVVDAIDAGVKLAR